MTRHADSVTEVVHVNGCTTVITLDGAGAVSITSGGSETCGYLRHGDVVFPPSPAWTGPAWKGWRSASGRRSVHPLVLAAVRELALNAGIRGLP